ncbi:MAG TPA: NADH-quinone oxidoreductase subunit L [Acidobacteriota bacterium]|nr:NADH-quinone oxidoreductase subunit L [Acidobacteriota bacterium]
MTEYLWLIPLIPLAGAAVNGLAGKRFPKSAVTLTACGASGISFILAVISFVELLQFAPAQRHLLRVYFNWIASGDFVARAEFLLDPLSAVMILVVTGVGFVIHIYSIGYMHAEDGYYRFFAYMNLFLFSMLILVLSGNFLMMFVGWEGVGLCSYLLIGYYFDRRSAGDAGKKAFIVNRIGDVGFILGVFLIFTTFNTLNFGEVFRQIAEGTARFPVETGVGVLTATCLLLFVGATGKSAQIPLYVWLPDAMEGPTPVSALIHAATMVTAGVYMVVRCSPMFSRAPIAMETVMIVGILTALMAATIGLVQTDIKRVLAYSTVSQLGYMFVAAGVGAFSAGIFHLMTHAFFKALLFLGAGSVIHAMSGEQDLTRMGGLRKYTPVTFWTMLVAALAISGIFPLAGFFSKDEILWSAWSRGHPVVWVVGFITAGLTAFYMFRLIFLTFFGNARCSESVRHHLHESPASMTGPLVVLGVLSILGGFIGLPAWLGTNRFFHFLEPSLEFTLTPEHAEASHSVEMGFAALSILAALSGIFVAYRLFIANPDAAESLAARWKKIHQLLYRKYYVDELYDATIVNPVLGASTRTLWKRADVGIIDRAVNGAGETIQGLASMLKNVQNGLIRSYAAWILLGTVAILLYFSFFRS